MKVTVPFAYTAKLQAPISKRVEDVVKTEMLSHDIPEIGGAETTLVATWQHRDEHRVYPLAFECRTYADSYFYPMGGGRSATTSQIQYGLTPAQAYAGLEWYNAARHAWFYDGYRQRVCHNALHGKIPRARAKGATQLDSDRDLELGKAINGLSDLIVIDDTLWCRARPPRIVLSVWNWEGARRGTISVVGSLMGLQQASITPCRSIVPTTDTNLN
jgi:hypothetical protein